MKPDLNKTINKLIAYSFDNLLLDPLDEVYTLNRLATVCGVPTPARDEDADYGNATLGELLDELGADIDRTAVTDIIMPMPRTVSMRFADLIDRNKQKAFDFLYDLYAHCDKLISSSAACIKDGYVCYAAADPAPALVSLPAIGAAYSPIAASGHVAQFVCEDDILADDVLAREAAFVTNYGGVIATRIDNGTYFTADTFALTEAATAKSIDGGAVKIALLDYAVPVLSFNGIAKNAVMREVARTIQRAADSELKPIVAASAKNGVTFYLVFAGDIAADGYLKAVNPLTACGVYATDDYSALLSVLEKGTALLTDLIEFKPIYEAIGGVKHGAKAAATLCGFVSDKIKPTVAAAALATADAVVALTAAE